MFFCIVNVLPRMRLYMYEMCVCVCVGYVFIACSLDLIAEIRNFFRVLSSPMVQSRQNRRKTDLQLGKFGSACFFCCFRI